MPYSKQRWGYYDESKTEEQNIQAGNVFTPEKLNHIEDGIKLVEEETNRQLAQKANAADVANGTRFMGSTTFANLPTSANVGDFWYITDQSIYRMRSASNQWVSIGPGEDLGVINDIIDDLGLYQELVVSYPNNISYLTKGQTGVYPGWFSSEEIPCGLYKSIQLGAANYRNPEVAAVIFKDSNGNFISATNDTSGTLIDQTYYFYEGIVEVPINAATMIVSKVNRSATINSPNYVRVRKRTAKYNLDQIEKSRQAIESIGESSDEEIKKLKGIAAGDSLFEGDLGSDPAGTKNITSQNAIYFLQKYLGCTVQNAGKSGYSALMWWNNVAQTINYADKDFMLIMLGTNVGLTDTLEADTTISDGQTYLDYANTNTGSYCKIIEHAYAQSGKKIQIILVTPPHVGDRRISNKVAAEGARPVVKKIGQKYNLPVIDMNEAGFSKYTESVMQPVDGLHFSLVGYKKMGTFIGSQLKSLLSFLIEA